MKINCECNNEEAQIRWVRGNTQPLAIPLEQEVITENEEIRTEPYYPSESDKVTVYLVGRFKRKAFTPEIDGNVLIIHEDGTLSTGSYHVEVLIEHQDGTRNRSLWCNQVVITESNDTVLEEWDEFKQQEPQARAAIFFFAKGDKGAPFTYEDFTQEQIEDLKKPAVDAAAELTAEVQALESEFTESENERVANENQRKANEIARENAETAREEQSASDHTTALADHTTSVGDHTTAQSDHTTALSDHTQASSDHVTANGDHTRAESDHALAATDHTTATSDHQTAVQDNAQMTELVGRADADHVQATADHAAAESDHTTATSDHAQAATDHNAATSDHNTATSDHATASTDHSTAQSDHTTATNDHDTATTDHQTAVSDHSIADGDHTLASADHTTAQADHAQAASDHTRAENDNATATSDHTTAVSDHTTAAADHTQAVGDHTTAAADHTTAESDHAAVEVYVDSLGAFDLSKYNAVGGVLATYADLSAALTALNALDSKYKYGGMSFKFVRSSDNKYIQARCMAQNFITDVTKWQVVDAEPTDGSKNIVESGGVDKKLAHNVVFIDDPTTEDGYMSDSGIVDSSVTTYKMVRPILLNPGETITLNNGKETTIKYHGALLYETDSSGNWIRNIITRDTAGGSTISVAKFTNTSNSQMYVGTTIYVEGNTDSPVYNISKSVVASPENVVDKIVDINFLNSDVRKGYILSNGESISVADNRVYTQNYIKASPNTNYLLDLPSNYVYMVVFYNKQKAKIAMFENWSSQKGFKTPANTEYIRINFQNTGLTIDNFIPVSLIKTAPNDFIIQVKQDLTDALPNIDTVNKKLVFSTSARLWYNGTFISLANLELNYIVEYTTISLLIFSTSALNLRMGNIRYLNPDDIIVGYINHSNSADKKIFDVKLPFEYTIDGQSVNSKINNIEKELQNIKSKGSDWQNVYDLANDIKTDRPYFLNASYDSETSYNDSSYLDNKIRNIPDGKHFLFVTDTHIDYDNGMAQKETQIMAYIKSKLDIGSVVFGGDAIGQQSTPYKAAKVLAIYSEDKFNAFGPDFLWCQGNHDANANINSANRITSEEIYKRTTKPMQHYGKAVFDTVGLDIIDGLSITADEKTKAKAWMNLHYYYDDYKDKIRFIILETGDGSDGEAIVGSEFNGWETLIGYNTFIGNALQSTPNDFDVVVVMHQLLPGSSFTNTAEVTEMPQKGIGNVFAMLSAFKNKTQITITRDSTSQSSKPVLYALMNSTIGDGVTYDFSKRTSGRVFVISGHFHMDDAWVFQNSQSSPWYYAAKEYGQWDTVLSNAILAIQTDRGCLNDKGSWAGTSKAPHATTAPNNSDETRVGTTNEVLFDVVTITPDNKIVCTRIGAGSDRIFDLP